MKLRSTIHLAVLVAALGGLSLATGGKKADSDKEIGDVFAGDNANYVGEWSAPGTSVHIGKDRSFSFKQKLGASSKSFTGKVTKIGPGIVHVSILVDVKMNVQRPPTEEDGIFKMTMEGVELWKGTLTDQLKATITSHFKERGVTATDCPELTSEMTEFECTATLSNAKKAKVAVTHALETIHYDFKLKSGTLDPVKLNATLPADINKLKPGMVSTVDCGTKPIDLPFGESYECKGMNAKKKEVTITLDIKPDGTLHFEAKPK